MVKRYNQTAPTIARKQQTTVSIILKPRLVAHTQLSLETLHYAYSVLLINSVIECFEDLLLIYPQYSNV